MRYILRLLAWSAERRAVLWERDAEKLTTHPYEQGYCLRKAAGAQDAVRGYRAEQLLRRVIKRKFRRRLSRLGSESLPCGEVLVNLSLTVNGRELALTVVDYGPVPPA